MLLKVRNYNNTATVLLPATQSARHSMYNKTRHATQS